MISFGDPGERDSRVVTERDGRRSGAGDAVGFATPGPGLLYCLSGGGLLHAADLRFYFIFLFNLCLPLQASLTVFPPSI